MIKSDFIDFIKDLGFTQAWQSNSNYFILPTDIVGLPNQSYQAFSDQLNIHFDEKNELLVQLSLAQMSTHMMTGKNFGQFYLKTFGDPDDLQLQIFMSFVKGSFKNPPSNIIKYMRDRKIKDILS